MTRQRVYVGQGFEWPGPADLLCTYYAIDRVTDRHYHCRLRDGHASMAHVYQEPVGDGQVESCVWIATGKATYVGGGSPL